MSGNLGAKAQQGEKEEEGGGERRGGMVELYLGMPSVFNILKGFSIYQTEYNQECMGIRIIERTDTIT